MKIAIPSEGENISNHFGRSPAFTLAEVEGGEVRSTLLSPTPGRGHGAIVPFLLSHGIACVIASGMGERARDMLERGGVKIILGAHGSVREALGAFAQGRLSTAGAPGEGACQGDP